MKTFLLTIPSEKESQSVMRILNELLVQKKIGLNVYVMPSVAPSSEQRDEMLDESELAPYYSEQEAKRILKL